MERKKLESNVIAFNAAISGCEVCSQWQRGLACVTQRVLFVLSSVCMFPLAAGPHLLVNDFKLDIPTWARVNSCALLKQIGQSRRVLTLRLLRDMIEASVKPDLPKWP
ncbi:unnamed protein product [Polarella glacialis]|uniref:Uncharacterized protein n=2 Tax=Polarella glacialis TaxID=89957 RepID=A0A813KHX8_POLGL|nr:unnamed protein product [Polarella glacialis]